MARRPSGYEAVRLDLIKTTSFNQLIEQGMQNLHAAHRTVRLDEISTSYDTDLEIVYCRYNFSIAIGDRRFKRMVREITADSDTEAAAKLDWSYLFHSKDLRVVVDNHFGKDVGSRNCQPDVVVHGRHDCPRNKQLEDFQDWIVHRFEHKLDWHGHFCFLHEEKAAAEGRIAQKMISIINSPEIQEKRTEVLRDEAVKDIKSVLYRYREVPQDVVKRAFEEGLVEVVMRV